MDYQCSRQTQSVRSHFSARNCRRSRPPGSLSPPRAGRRSHGEAGLRHISALRESVEKHRTDEGWLVTARRISRAARDEVEKAENRNLACYTFDELLDQDAAFTEIGR